MQWRSPFCSMIFSSEYIFIADFPSHVEFPEGFCDLDVPCLQPVDQRVPGDVQRRPEDVATLAAALLGGEDFSPTRIENKLG